jgi:hypothetical protein
MQAARGAQKCAGLGLFCACVLDAFLFLTDGAAQRRRQCRSMCVRWFGLCRYHFNQHWKKEGALLTILFELKLLNQEQEQALSRGSSCRHYHRSGPRPPDGGAVHALAVRTPLRWWRHCQVRHPRRLAPRAIHGGLEGCPDWRARCWRGASDTALASISLMTACWSRHMSRSSSPAPPSTTRAPTVRLGRRRACFGRRRARLVRSRLPRGRWR